MRFIISFVLIFIFPPKLTFFVINLSVMRFHLLLLVSNYLTNQSKFQFNLILNHFNQFKETYLPILSLSLFLQFLILINLLILCSWYYHVPFLVESLFKTLFIISLLVLITLHFEYDHFIFSNECIV